jgi:peptidoglycan/LPS O-acetylase OafA/YrhL
MQATQAGPAAHGHSATGRVPQLDSIRGIAATTVVLHHLWDITQFRDPPWYLVPFTAGREAVILFFVLSGYVLSLPYWRGRQPPYPVYFVRRCFRIYVPFAAALALSAVGCAFFYRNHLPLTAFYYRTWQQPVTLSLFAHQLLMPDDGRLNGAIWSLRYEMEMSILFPFVCALLAWTKRYYWILVVILLRVAEMALAHSALAKRNMLADDLSSLLYYALFFVVGAVLARDRGSLNRRVFLLPTVAVWCGFLLSFALYFNSMFGHLTTPPRDLLTMMGAAGFILLVQDPRLTVGLHTVTAQYLGRISYSMYLVHYTVIFALFDLLYGRIPTPALIAACLIVTLGLSHLFCIGVEEQALVAGRRVSNRVAEWLQARRAAA